MERLVTVRDMRERYQCSYPTARKYLRQVIPHMENPLTAPEWAVQEWEASRTVIPPEIGYHRRQWIQNQAETVYVPRRREG